MYFYKAILYLNGLSLNQVRKVVSAPEFLILQYIHGKDSLHGVEEVKNEKINPAQERTRLKHVYDKALKRKKQSVDDIFGPLSQLPIRLPDDILEKFNIDGAKEIPEIGRISVTENRLGNTNVPKTEKEQQNLDEIVSADEVRIADLLD